MSRAKQALYWLDNLDRPSARAVLGALGEEWQRVGEIQQGAHALGVKVGGGIYSILDALCMADLAQKRGGRIEQYRLRREERERPAGDEDSQRGLKPPESPTSTTSPGEPVADTLRAIPDPEDDEAPREVVLDHLYGWMDEHDAELGRPDQEAGRCGECGKDARVRWTFGKFVLCRDCRRIRAQAAAKSGEAVDEVVVTGSARCRVGDPVPPRRGLVVTEAPPELAEELAERLSQNGSNENGNYDDPWRSEP